MAPARKKKAESSKKKKSPSEDEALKESSSKNIGTILSLWVVAVACFWAYQQQNSSTTTTTSTTRQLTTLFANDPHLQEMTFDVGNGPETTLVYVDPDPSSYYPHTTTDAQKKRNFAGKFINISPQRVSVYW